ncbi:Myosin type-2 heavy chain 1 [Coemansia sp. Benny D115]|nr:Myosin type-2 heavy chain 1 [Coemansia sp. Benny D115]
MPFALGDPVSIAQALKILEPYTKGAKAWFEDDGGEAWIKGTLVQRTDDQTVGISRLVFIRDDSVASTTAQLVAQASSSQSSLGASPDDKAEGRGRRRRHSIKAAPLEDLLRMVTRGSRLTGGRISSMQKVENSYVVDIAFGELAEPNADSELLPPLCNPPFLDCTEDLTALSYLHEPAVLYNLRSRYEQQQIYTYSGVVLVAMNPFHAVPLYTPEYMALYARGRQGSGQSEEPHLFAIAESAYRGMVNNRRNQTIIVYGESGSGKTTSAKYIMRYFAQAHHADTNDKQMSTVESQILATNPVFESFGNAKTTRNDNSSRFGKFLDIKFERKQQRIVGGRIRTFLLERSRVAYQPATERNYHIFYQLLAGASAAQREAFHLGGEHATWQAFHYTRQGGEGSGSIAGVDDAEDFSVTDASLEMVGIDAQRRSDIWRTLAGILHLGNVSFSGSETLGAYVDVDSEQAFSTAAALLGVGATKLRQWLTKRQIVTRHDHILAKVNKAQALVIRDSIAKFVYARLFDWILGPINGSLLPTEVDESATSFVGVLDIYGFEHFEHNSFEQFCINYANEKLQQNFNHHVFKLEQEEYKREQLTDWTFIGFRDNQPCIDLIEGKLGVLALLDEESRLEQGSDRTFTEKLYRQFGSADSTSGGASFFRKPRFSNTAFTVCHYAHDVTYEGDGFLEKNKDTVPDEVLELLCASTFGFVADLAASMSTANAAAVQSSTVAGSSPIAQVATGSSPRVGMAPGFTSGRSSPAPSRSLGGRRQAPTLAGVFKRSLTGLMATLAETEMHYVRCIKPNEAKAAWKFQAPMVLSQLRSCGVIETIRISKAGYPSRVPVRTFNERYAMLIEETIESSASLDEVPTDQEKMLCQRILLACLPDATQYQIGRTKVFFRAGQWAILEKKRSALFEKSAVIIQKFCRGVLIRRSYQEMVTAATLIQRRYRAHLLRIRVEAFKRRQAVRTIERIRGVLARKRVARMAEIKRMEQLAQLRAESERSLKLAELERQRAEEARRLAESERIRQATQAARQKAQLAAAEQHRDSDTQGLISDTHLDLDSEPEDPAEYDEYADHEPIVHLHSDADKAAATEVFTRLAVDPPPPGMSSTLSSFADLRRMSTQSNEAARQRTAEARASLIAAGTAGRNAEAELNRQASTATSTVCSPTTLVSSGQRNTFGFHDGAAAFNQQVDVMVK